MDIQSSVSKRKGKQEAISLSQGPSLGQIYCPPEGEGSMILFKKEVNVYERDIICLPLNYSSQSGVLFPRAKVCTELGRQDLIGEIHLDSTMSETKIFRALWST